jgi:hypothetical protein
MIFTTRIASVLHVFSFENFHHSRPNLQGYPRRRTSRTFPFNKCHKTVHRNSLIAIYLWLTWVVRGSSFIIVSAWQFLLPRFSPLFNSVAIKVSKNFQSVTPPDRGERGAHYPGKWIVCVSVRTEYSVQPLLYLSISKPHQLSSTDHPVSTVG